MTKSSCPLAGQGNLKLLFELIVYQVSNRASVREPPGKEATNFVAWPRLLPMKSSVTFLLKCRVALTLSFVGVVPLEAPGAQVMLSFETFVLPVKRFVVGRGL